MVRYETTYGVFLEIATGLSNISVCQPVVDSLVNVPLARTAPWALHSVPSVRPGVVDALVEPDPVTCPTVSAEKVTPRVTGPSGASSMDGTVESSKRLQGHTPGAGAGLTVVKDHCFPVVTAPPWLSVPPRVAVYLTKPCRGADGVKVMVRVTAS